MTTRTPSHGRWQPGIAEAERVARLREFRGLVAVLAGGARQPPVQVLTHPETDPAALAEAAVLFDAIPTRWQRRVLCTIAALGRRERPARGPRTREEGGPDAA